MVTPVSGVGGVGGVVAGLDHAISRLGFTEKPPMYTASNNGVMERMYVAWAGWLPMRRAIKEEMRWPE